MSKRIALMLCLCLLAGTLPAALAEEIVSAPVETAVDAEEFELAGTEEAAEADIAAAEWNEEAPEDPGLVPKKAAEFVIEHYGADQELTGYNGKGGDVVFPEGLTQIYARGLFEDNLTSVTFPTTMNTIMDSVFEGQTHLTKAVFQSDVFLGEYVFAYCDKLKTVVLPEGFTAIGYGCFEGCAGLKHIDLPGTLKSIHTYAFSGSGLEDIALNEGLEFIGEAPFYGCMGLKEITLPASLEEVCSGAFENCSNLKTVTILNAKTKLANSVFETWNDDTEAMEPSCAKGLTLRGWPGSTAEAYAKEWGYNFEPLVKVTKVKLDKTGTQKLALGKKLALSATLTPADANLDTDVTWTSGNEAVATVSEQGVVTPVGKGKAKITAVAGGAKASVTVQVIDPLPTKLTLCKGSSKLKNGAKLSVTLGSKLALTTKLTPDDAASKLSWQSSNAKVAKVSAKGVVTPVKKGSAVITVRTANGLEAKVTVNVAAPKPTKVVLYKGSAKLKSKQVLTLSKGKTVKLTAKLTPKLAETTFTWSTSDKKVATVTKAGKVKAVGTGKATVTVKTGNKLTAVVVIKVK